MFNSDTELLFPTRVIPTLRDLRGDAWGDLIDRLTRPDADQVEQIAFTLMVARLGGCGGCNADSFRAMRGCTQCAKLTIRRNKQSDVELIQLFQDSHREVKEFLSKKEQIISKEG